MSTNKDKFKRINHIYGNALANPPWLIPFETYKLIRDAVILRLGSLGLHPRTQSNPGGIISGVRANHLSYSRRPSATGSNYYLKWMKKWIPIPAGSHNKTSGQVWTSLSLIRMSQSPSADTEEEGNNNLWPCMLMRSSAASGCLTKYRWTSPLRCQTPRHNDV